MDINLFSEEEIRQYKKEGYIIVERLIDKTTLDEIDKAIQELTDKALAMDDFSSILELEPEELDGKPVPRRIYNAFIQHEVFSKLGTNPLILDRIEQFIGPDIQLQLSKLNMKPPKVGSVVEWHQDLAYFPHTNDDLVTTLVYLDDATEENGCLQVLPRLHHGHLNHSTSDGLFAGMITENITDGSYGEPVPLSAPAGSVIFMHCLLPHSSLPNNSDMGRRTVIYEYRASDSYPLYFGDMVPIIEEVACQVRGESAPYARLGSIAPQIPHFPGKSSSLYDLQSKTKERMAQEK